MLSVMGAGSSGDESAEATCVKRFYIETQGCQMNVYDSEFLCDVLVRGGYTRTSDPHEASVILVNTCSVRGRAEAKAAARITELSSLKRKRPDLVLAVVGCMAQRLGAGLAQGRTGADIVAGFDAYPAFPDLIEDARRRQGSVVRVCENPRSLHSTRPATRGSLKAFVTIMQGCDNFCSYCIVPLVRGRERSKPAGVILEEIRHLVGLGVKEVTLIGQNVNSYRDKEVDFTLLLEMVDRVPGLGRIRFTTSHPKDLTLGLVERIRDLPKVCEHLHLPLQSGSDRVLALMNRKYACGDFKQIVRLARHTIPGLAVTTDIMVGFPTETRVDFEETLAALEQCRFDGSFMFRYSQREGTAAGRLADDVPMEEKTRRLTEVISLQNRLTDESKQALVGRDVEVLVEETSPREAGFMTGRTRENWLAKIPAEGVRKGETVVAKVAGVTRWMIACGPSLRKVGA
jgi:tRNA-2-methylthio-N6-dimethylallyladenosine synthase